MFAVCCHHKCSWNETAGRYWLEQVANITCDEFSLITSLASWAVCGFQRKSPHCLDACTDNTNVRCKEALQSGNEDECLTVLLVSNTFFQSFVLFLYISTYSDNSGV
ncbi:unnamed protein product [Trichobilharzia regenti]|nr:unnamed protein product [Trichobilharzia regenti]